MANLYRTLIPVATLVLFTVAVANAKIIVNTLDDGGAEDLGNGFCSLREALANAESNSEGTSGDCASGGSFPDTVSFAVTGTIVLTEGVIIFSGPTVIDGPGAHLLTVSGDNKGMVLVPNDDDDTFVFKGLTIADGRNSGKGGAMLIVGSGMHVIFDRVHFKNNLAKAGGGAIAVNPTDAQLTITNSTFSGNFAGDDFSESDGGAIHTAGPVSATNVTFSGNTALGDGGALYLDGVTAQALLDNVTIVYNTAGLSGGGVATNSGGSSTYKNSIIAGNIVTGTTDGSDNDCSGTSHGSEDFNVLGDGTGCGIGSDIETNAVYTVVDTLADNGGQVPTHALVFGSPALDAGATKNGGTFAGGCDSIDNETISEDARGEFRAQGASYGGSACDIGAYEAQSLPTGFQAVLTVLLEGPYLGSGLMSSGPDAPVTQPFSDSTFDGSILDYDGSETVVSTESTDIVDWVLLKLKDGATVVAEQAVFLMIDGNVLNGDFEYPKFASVPAGSYSVVVAHRNHLPIQSSSTVNFTTGTGLWNFTTSLAKAYSGGGDSMKDLGSSKFGMFACDANVDGQITAPDFNLWNASTTAGETGYLQADCNMDGQVTAPDFNLWNANTTAGAASQVPD